MVKNKKMDRNRIKLGIEIECCFNSGLIDIEQQKKNGWDIVGDGSLRNSDIFENENSLEFVSEILGSKKTYIKALKDFRGFFGNYPLDEVLSFNNTSGTHIHIGLSKNKKYHEKLSYDFFIELRELFFKSIKESDKLSEDTKQKILNQYFRYYAKQIDKIKWNEKDNNNRYQEFNTQSENEGRGIEWRSINLCGVKTWQEFNAVFEIVYNCAEYLFKERTTKHKTKFKTIRLNRTELKQIQKNHNEKIVLNLKGNSQVTININQKLKNEVLQCVI